MVDSAFGAVLLGEILQTQFHKKIPPVSLEYPEYNRRVSTFYLLSYPKQKRAFCNPSHAEPRKGTGKPYNFVRNSSKL